MQAEAPGHPVSNKLRNSSDLGAANDAVTVHSADARRGDHDMGSHRAQCCGRSASPPARPHRVHATAPQARNVVSQQQQHVGPTTSRTRRGGHGRLEVDWKSHTSPQAIIERVIDGAIP